MGHSELHLLTAAFGTAQRLSAEELGVILDTPSMFDTATQRFIPSLNKLRASREGKNTWKQADYVRAAYKLIEDDYGDEQDHSRALMVWHPMQVADDAFRLARLFGFSNKEATVVWLAALCHDYLERRKNAADLETRKKKIHTLFDSLDPDVFNLVSMLTNNDKARPYFFYVQEVGAMDGFSESSTRKAQLAAWIIKLCDSSHNARPDRNDFLDQETARAQDFLSSADEAEQEKGHALLAVVERKRTKVSMYRINIGFMRQKIKGWLGLEDGLPANATMVDFLLSDVGLLINAYKKAREVGLGEAENNRLLDLIDARDATNDHKMIIVRHLGVPPQTTAVQPDVPHPQAA